MFDKIKALLQQRGVRPPSAEAFSERDVAVAALLLEAASADGDYADGEHAQLSALLARKLALAPDRADTLLELGRARQRDAVELFRFTDAVKKAMNEEERGSVVEMLWEVVYADGVLDAFEDRLIRSVAALLHVPDRIRAEARQRVLARIAGGA
jgi:uncharacterized tellurite resistance protein B-like protein